SADENQSWSRSEILICCSSCRGSALISLRGEDFPFPKQQQREHCWERQQSQVIYRSAYRHTRFAAQVRSAQRERVEPVIPAARSMTRQQKIFGNFSVDGAILISLYH